MSSVALRSAPAATPLRRARGWAATTPGRLRSLGVLLAIAAVLVAVVAAEATASRRSAADAVAGRSERLMLQADDMYASLSDAQATAAATFLTGGVEPPARRARYLRDLRRASLQLTSLTSELGGSGADPAATRAVATVSAQLPVYSGLIETARANNRQGFPVGAAYLREASGVMSGSILPAAKQLYAIEARHLGDDLGTGTSTTPVVAVAIVGALALALLVGAQLFVARRTRRTFNLPLLAATVLLAGLLAWILIAMGREQNALARAQRDGSDAVQVLSASRILALRAQSDESLALVARGGGDQYVADFDATMRALAPPRGLLAAAGALARRSGSPDAVTAADSALSRLRGVHARIAGLESGGRFGEAVGLAVGPHAPEAAAAQAATTALDTAVAGAQARFAARADTARTALDGLWIAIPLLALLAGGLALLGLQRRLREYR